MLDQINYNNASKSKSVFFNPPNTTLFLFTDFKSDDLQLSQKLLVEKYLSLLTKAGYLTHMDLESSKMVWKQITVVRTDIFPRD